MWSPSALPRCHQNTVCLTETVVARMDMACVCSPGGEVYRFAALVKKRRLEQQPGSQIGIYPRGGSSISWIYS